MGDRLGHHTVAADILAPNSLTSTVGKMMKWELDMIFIQRWFVYQCLFIYKMLSLMMLYLSDCQMRLTEILLHLKDFA